MALRVIMVRANLAAGLNLVTEHKRPPGGDLAQRTLQRIQLASDARLFVDLGPSGAVDQCFDEACVLQAPIVGESFESVSSLQADGTLLVFKEVKFERLLEVVKGGELSSTCRRPMQPGTNGDGHPWKLALCQLLEHRLRHRGCDQHKPRRCGSA